MFSSTDIYDYDFMQLSFKSDRSKTYYQNKCIYSFYFLCGSFIGALYFFMWIQVTVCILCFQSVGLPLVFLIGQVCLATNSSSFCLSGNVLFSLILKDNFAWLTVFFFFLIICPPTAFGFHGCWWEINSILSQITVMW